MSCVWSMESARGKLLLVRSRELHLPVTGRSLGSSVGVVVHDVQVLSHGVHVGALKVIESGVEGQAGAHPEEHAGAQTVTRGPEVVTTVSGILQILGHRLNLFFGLEGGQLQTQRPTILVGEEVVELGRVRVHPANEVLDTVQLDGGDALTWTEQKKRRRKRCYYCKCKCGGKTFVANMQKNGSTMVVENYVIYQINYTHTQR